MRCDIPGFLAELAPKLGVRPERVRKPLVAVDENLNAQQLSQALRPLVGNEVISGVDPLWYERYQNSAGEPAYSPGSLSRRAQAQLGLTGRDGWSSDDEFALCNLIVKFTSYDSLVLLTADRGTDPKGMGRLLKEVVAPAVAANHGNRLSLTVLGRSGTRQLPTYVSAVVDRLLRHPFTLGYTEEWL